MSNEQPGYYLIEAGVGRMRLVARAATLVEADLAGEVLCQLLHDLTGAESIDWGIGWIGPTDEVPAEALAERDRYQAAHPEDVPGMERFEARMNEAIAARRAAAIADEEGLASGPASGRMDA